MAEYGLLATGFVPKTLEVIREEINADLRTRFGSSIDLSDSSILGQIVAIVSEKFAELWEAGQDVASSQDPDQSTQAALDALCALTGTTREPASPSTVTLTLTGTPATSVPSGNRAATTSTGQEFETLTTVVIAVATSWTGAATLVVADFTVTANAGTDELTKTAHGLLTGDGPLRIASSGSLPGGLSAGVDYWVIRTGPDTFKFATSLANALAGTPVDITSAGSGTHTVSDTGSTVRPTAYALGARRTNSSRVYQVITAGTSGNAGGPTTTASDITDGTVHWRYLGEGTAVVDVDAEAVENGPTVAVSGDITTIVTPVGGWASVINILDADVGTNVETDEVLRARRESELAAAGTGTADAVRAAVLDVDDVESCTVFVNDTELTDPDGVPPHSIEVLVRGGDDQDIVDAIFATKAAGIRAFGNTNGTAIDSEGTEHDVDFSRPDEIEIYVDVELEYDADLYPEDGDAQVKAAIVAFGDKQKCGKNAVASSISAQSFKVAGVIDVTVCDIGIASNPSSDATIAIGTRELAVFDTSRITVVSTPGTP